MKTIPVRKISSGYAELHYTGQFSIRRLKDVLKGKDMVHELHKHDFFLVMVLEKGEGVHEIDFIKYPVGSHSVFILRPGQVHMLQLKSSASGFIMEFAPAFYKPRSTAMDRLWKKASARNYCKPGASGFKKLYAVLSDIFNEYEGKQEGYMDGINAGLDLFFIEHVRQGRNGENKTKAVSSYVLERFEELQGLLQTHISTKKSPSQYAGLLNLSLYQLNAITKSSVGKPVSDLINEQIILEAKRYLLATPNQVKDIADHLGYDDVSYFIRFFKKQTGYTPDAFRQNSR